MPTQPPTPDEIKEALGPKPALAKDWSFANDSRWAEWIATLSEKATHQLVQERQHLQSVKRVQAALAKTKKVFVQRDRELEMMVACAIAQVNLVFLGPPGTGKSLLVRKFAEALGVRNETRHISQETKAVKEAMKHAKEGTTDDTLNRRYFEYLLTRYTTPEELFGGVDITVLLEGNVHSRCTRGMLPQAEIVFLDEIFKANSAILNTLLSLTNEGIFFNLGQAFRVNLAFVVGASNESPDPNELGALFDRFPIRVACHPVPDKKLRSVIEEATRMDREKLFRQEKPKDQEMAESEHASSEACLNDLRFLTKVAATNAIQDSEGDFMNAFCELTLRLRGEYGISDRTPARILRVCRALALLEANPDQQPRIKERHLRAWGYVAPRYQEAAVLQRFVQDHISGKDPSAVNLFE